MEEVNTHQKSFKEVAKDLQNHEQHNANNGAVAQQMVQYINSLFEENEDKSHWISTLRNEAMG